jgi:hypothetical protein
LSRSDSSVGAEARRPSALVSGLAGRLLLLGTSLLFCAAAVGLAEAGLRLFTPASLADAPALQPYVHSPAYGWTLRPGFAGKTRDGRLVRVNARGFRGPEPAAPAPGRRRVLLLGDSITFGTGVDEAETFAERLGAVSPALLGVNLGVSGYGTDQELLLLEREGFAFRPDAVVLNVCVGNDAFDNALPVYLYDGATPKPHFTLAGRDLTLHDAHVPLRGPALLARRLLERSLLFDAVLRAGGRGGAAPLDHDDGEHWGPRARGVLERWPEAVALSRRLVARTAELCAARGVAFLVALHPNRRAFEGDDGLLEPFIPGPAAEAPGDPSEGGAPRTLDLRTAYAGLAWSDVALDKLGHLNPRGHSLAAEALARALSP